MIKKFKEQHICEVARIHRRELSGFLPELGNEFLNLFYRTSLTIPEMFTIVFQEKGKVIGFVTSITMAKGLNKNIFLSQPVGFGMIVLRYFITHPGKIFKFIKLMTYPGFSEGGAELLSLAVNRNRRLQGIGKKLLAASVKEFKRRSIRKFKISVYDRLLANGFYKKLGCRKVSSFEFLGEKMNYYEFNIRK